MGKNAQEVEMKIRQISAGDKLTVDTNKDGWVEGEVERVINNVNPDEIEVGLNRGEYKDCKYKIILSVEGCVHSDVDKFELIVNYTEAYSEGHETPYYHGKYYHSEGTTVEEIEEVTVLKPDGKIVEIKSDYI